LRVVDRFGCSVDTTVTLSEPPEFWIDLGEDREVTLGESVRLVPTTSLPIASYAWEPLPPGCDTTNCADPTFFPTETERYTLVATSAAGCQASATVRVAVVPQRPLYLPSAFSPNGDGTNDQFLPLGNAQNVQRIQVLRVYDRWGGLVYERTDLPPNDPNTGWDGTIRGEPAPPGSYTYAVEVLFIDGFVGRYSGAVLLLR